MALEQGGGGGEFGEAGASDHFLGLFLVGRNLHWESLNFARSFFRLANNTSQRRTVIICENIFVQELAMHFRERKNAPTKYIGALKGTVAREKFSN